MSRILTVVLQAAFFFVISLPPAAADQYGAERTKRPVRAKIIRSGDQTPEGEHIGNVEVTYADGTNDRWTVKGNCGQAHVAADGTVGWTIYDAERKPPTIAYTVRNNSTLMLCRQGKVVARIRSQLGFIEDWNFLGGKEIVLRTRALHGVARMERHDSATGNLPESVEAYPANLPVWAKPFADR